MIPNLIDSAPNVSAEPPRTTHPQIPTAVALARLLVDFPHLPQIRWAIGDHDAVLDGFIQGPEARATLAAYATVLRAIPREPHRFWSESDQIWKVTATCQGWSRGVVVKLSAVSDASEYPELQIPLMAVTAC